MKYFSRDSNLFSYWSTFSLSDLLTEVLIVHPTHASDYRVHSA